MNNNTNPTETTAAKATLLAEVRERISLIEMSLAATDMLAAMRHELVGGRISAIELDVKAILAATRNSRTTDLAAARQETPCNTTATAAAPAGSDPTPAKADGGGLRFGAVLVPSGSTNDRDEYMYIECGQHRLHGGWHRGRWVNPSWLDKGNVAAGLYLPDEVEQDLASAPAPPGWVEPSPTPATERFGVWVESRTDGFPDGWCMNGSPDKTYVLSSATEAESIANKFRQIFGSRRGVTYTVRRISPDGKPVAEASSPETPDNSIAAEQQAQADRTRSATEARWTDPATRQQADAWQAVYDTLGRLCPDWWRGPGATVKEKAIAAIERLAAPTHPSPSPETDLIVVSRKKLRLAAADEGFTDGFRRGIQAVLEGDFTATPAREGK